MLRVRLQGIAIDPDQDFLFAAGQDCRLRAWSLRTGLPLFSEKLPDDRVNVFGSLFPSPISALQVTTSEVANSLSLWAAYDHNLCQFPLGQRSSMFHEAR
jgi:WD repeat-containing protein 21A